MSEAYAREILRRNVAQICQTIGWNGINSTPLDILVHVLEKYIRTLGTQANSYAEQCNRTEPNLHDLGLVFRDLHVQLPELAEYTRCVPPVPAPLTVEKFPKPKESNLNFLKPGSHEVVTRPMHVHEHLPPMYPEKERETPIVADTVEIRQNGIDTVGTSNSMCTSPEISVTDSPEKPKAIFKRPSDPVSFPNSKRPRLRLEEEERTREISSVMMTMSGFLSPAREGKLPEAKAPTIISEKHHDKHKANSHHSNLAKVPPHASLDKSDKKSKKHKMLNGKIVKSKRKDKSHKGVNSKTKDINKVDKHPPGYPSKSKEIHPTHHNHITMPAPKVTPPMSKAMPPPPAPPVVENIRPVIKQEPVDHPPPPPPVNRTPGEDAIPVPRKIPISKSPLVANPVAVNKTHTNSLIPEIDIKKEVVEDAEKLASQPDRSKINIFKRISNKSKEDKNAPEVVTEKVNSNSTVSRLQNSTPLESTSENKSYESVSVKSEDSYVNNNDDSALDLSKAIDLTSHEVISIDDDSLDMHPMQNPNVGMLNHPQPPIPTHPLAVNKTSQLSFPKDAPSVSPKVKREKKHKDKKDKAAEKAAKLEAKLLKKQQQQLAFEMAQSQKQNLKVGKSPKLSKPKNDSKHSQKPPPGFPFFPNMPPGRGLIPGPGVIGSIPGPGLIPGGDFLAGFPNPALRGLPSPNLLANPYAFGAGGPGLIPGPSFLPGNLGPGMKPYMLMGNFPLPSRSSKIPSMLRRPSLEVIPVENDEDRGLHKSPNAFRDRDRHDKHKSPTIPNILQKHKPKSHKEHHKSNMFKIPPIQPDITIELNPPKEPERVEPTEVQRPVRSPTPPPAPAPEPGPPPVVSPSPVPVPIPLAETSPDKDLEKSEKKKDKSHKKEKRDKDGLKIKKKKDKKDKSKDKSEKKKDKEEKHEVKDRIKKEKKEKKKDKVLDGLVPKLTLKLGSSSPMPPSSPDVFKLNIKPIVKREEEDSPPQQHKEEPLSREHSRSPELAQFSALVTRPPKQKHSKHNHTNESEPKSPPASGSSPPRKNQSSSKYKRILFKSLAKKGDAIDDEAEPMAEEVPPVTAPVDDKPVNTPLPTPYYVDEQGNQVWVCPACGRRDNGSPMIGCDGCDGWYHWVCVGINEDPGATEDWFCRSCSAKRASMVSPGFPSGKKRGRKPKGEKIRDCN